MKKFSLQQLLSPSEYKAPKFSQDAKENIFSCTINKRVSLLSRVKYFVPVGAVMIVGFFVLSNIDSLNIGQPVEVIVDDVIIEDGVVLAQKYDFVTNRDDKNNDPVVVDIPISDEQNISFVAEDMEDDYVSVSDLVETESDLKQLLLTSDEIVLEKLDNDVVVDFNEKQNNNTENPDPINVDVTPVDLTKRELDEKKDNDLANKTMVSDVSADLSDVPTVSDDENTNTKTNLQEVSLNLNKNILPDFEIKSAILSISDVRLDIEILNNGGEYDLWKLTLDCGDIFVWKLISFEEWIQHIFIDNIEKVQLDVDYYCEIDKQNLVEEKNENNNKFLLKIVKEVEANK